MDGWRQALRDLMVPAEAILLVVAVVSLVFVVWGGRARRFPLPPLHARVLAVVLVVNVVVAVVSQLWVGASALALMLVAVTVAAQRWEGASSNEE